MAGEKGLHGADVRTCRKMWGVGLWKERAHSAFRFIGGNGNINRYCTVLGRGDGIAHGNDQVRRGFRVQNFSLKLTDG